MYCIVCFQHPSQDSLGTLHLAAFQYRAWEDKTHKSHFCSAEKWKTILNLMRKQQRAQYSHKSAANNMGFYEILETWDILHPMWSFTFPALAKSKVHSAHSMGFWAMIHKLILYSTEFSKLSLIQFLFSSSPPLAITYQNHEKGAQTISSGNGCEQWIWRRGMQSLVAETTLKKHNTPIV